MTEVMEKQSNCIEKQIKSKKKRKDTFFERIQIKIDAQMMKWFQKSPDLFNKADVSLYRILRKRELPSSTGKKGRLN